MKTLRLSPMALAFATAALFATTVMAQGPGGRGGGPGGGGPGGRGGFGGPGGNSMLSMALLEPIQEEIKATDTQKEKLKELNEAVQAKRQALRPNRGGNGGGNGGNGGAGGGAQANAGGGNGGGNGNGNGGGGGGNGGGGRGGRGNRGGGAQVADAQGGNGGGNGNGGGGNGGGGGRGGNGGGGGRGGNGGGGGFGGNGGGGFGGGGFGGGGFGGNGGGGQANFLANMTDEQREAFQARMAAAEKLTKDTDAALAKILDTKQRARIAQIQLQQQGVNAFRTPDLIAKLNINEDTQAQINEVLNGQNQARRANGAQMREFMAQLVPDAANNNNGGNGGGRGNFQQIQEALQANPELQAKMDAQRKTMDETNKDLETKTKAGIARLLTKKQRDAYAKMVGAPYDLTKLRGPGGPFGGPGGPGGNNPNARPAAATAGAPAAAAADPAAPATKSLRSRRGSSAGSDDN